MPASRKPTSLMAGSPTRCCWRFTPTPAWAPRFSSDKRRSCPGEKFFQVAHSKALPMAKQDFISLAETSRETLQHFMAVARRLKTQHKQTGHNDRVAEGKVL